MPVFTSSIEVTADYPTIKPSLNLNFARSRSLDPRITFTRASVGTYVGRDGLIKTAGNDEARFDHDPVTLESLGLLIEESRTNSIAYSDGIGGGWGGNGVSLTTINSVNGPDGIAGVTEIRDNTGSSYHAAFYGTVPVDGSSSYTVSAWLKKGPNYRSDIGSGGRFQIYCSRGTAIPASIQITFDFDTLVGQNNVNSSSITQYPNGWIRVTFTFISNAAANVTPHFLLGNGGEYQGDATNSVYIWGAQVEQGSFPTSYIPTSGSAVTRAADEGNITGDAFSSFYNTTEGVLQTEFSRIGSVYNQMVVQFKDSDGSERIEIRGQGGSNDSFRMEVIEGGATSGQEYSFSSGGVVANVVGQFAKVNLAYKQNDFASTINGTLASIDNAGDVGVCDRVGIGYANYGIGYNGHIKNIIYYPKRLTNTQLQLLTS